MNTLLYLAHYEPISEVNGPGRRAVIWVQGCPKRCPACWNPNFLPFDKSNPIAIDSLAERILGDADRHQLEGVTFTGGEPFSQAPSLAELAALLYPRLTFMAFSGFTLDDLLRRPERDRRLLSCLDILVDGEFRKDQIITSLWRSSANQTVHFLTDRYRPPEDSDVENATECEIVIAPDGLSVTGFPHSQFMKLLESANGLG